jgi:hypothetical protein
MGKTIIHVYRHGECGFADFLRSIYCIHNIANSNGYSYKIAFNHPIGEFFDVDTTVYETTVRTHTDLLKAIDTNTQLIVLESNHIDSSTPTPKNLIQDYVRPLPSLTESVEAALKELKLLQNQFIVLHARYGDSDSVGKPAEYHKVFLRRIANCIGIIKQNRLPILLISSSSVVTDQFRNTPGVLTTGFTPCHTYIATDATALKNTLVEFYIMNFAKKIYSISGGTFGTGKSGFSYWASKMFNVPFSHVEV